MSSDGAAGSPLGSGAVRLGTFSGSIAGCSPVGGLASGPWSALSPQPCRPRTAQVASASSGSPALIQAITLVGAPLCMSQDLVDPRGFEPLTYRLPVCRAPKLRHGPTPCRCANKDTARLRPLPRRRYHLSLAPLEYASARSHNHRAQGRRLSRAA